MILRSLFLALLALGASAPAWGQSPNANPSVDVLRAVISYRQVWLEDSTHFHACHAFERLGRPAGFPEQLPPEARRLLDRPERPCAPMELLARRVVLDSVQVSDTTAFVALRVIKGERSHVERYTLRRFRGEALWRVREVVLSGGMYFLPVRPPQSPALLLAFRGEVISHALFARRDAVEERVHVDACSIYEQMDRSPDYLRYLRELVHPMLSSTSADPCAEDITPPPYRGWLSVERIAAETPDRIVVEAHFRVPRSFFREEFYDFRLEGEELYPRGVRLMPGLYSDWQPIIPPTPEPAPDPTIGYLVPDTQAARTYGLRSGDTLPELAPRQVPEVVQTAAGKIANELAWSHSCTRYFAAGERYLILLQGTCPRVPTPGLIDERERIGLLAADGTPVSMVLLGVGSGTVFVLCPSERDVYGRAANPYRTPDGCDRPPRPEEFRELSRSR